VRRLFVLRLFGPGRGHEAPPVLVGETVVMALTPVAVAVAVAVTLAVMVRLA
jgi:hypothetical protein